jgi:hypothetical protein
MSSKEITVDLLGRYSPMYQSAPSNPMEALMQAAPGEEPHTSMEELLPLREAVADCLDKLSEQDRWIVDCLNSERVSLQELGDRLSVTKTQAWRLRNKAFDNLKERMLTNSLIRKKLGMKTTWDLAAQNIVLDMAISATHPCKSDHRILEAERDRLADDMRNNDYRHSYKSFDTMAAESINDLRDQEVWDSAEMIKLLCRKQHDYGHGNINKFGMAGIIVRLSDKVERLKNLRSRGLTPEIKESEVDTLLDIVGYCVIGHMWNEGTFQNELSEEWA